MAQEDTGFGNAGDKSSKNKMSASQLGDEVKCKNGDGEASMAGKKQPPGSLLTQHK